MIDNFNNNLENIEKSILKYFNSKEIQSLILDTNKNNKSRITFDLNHIEKYDKALSTAILNYPLNIIPLMEKYMNEIIQNIKIEANSQSKYSILDIKKEQIHINFENILKTHIVFPKDLKNEFLNKYVEVQGIVTRLSKIKAKLYSSNKNDSIKNIIENNEDIKLSLKIYENSTSNYRFNDYQTFILQDPIEIIIKGELPKSIEVILEDDLVDKIKIGEIVKVNGIFKSISNFENVRNTLIATNIEKMASFPHLTEFSEEIINQIKNISKNKEIINLLANSICPYIDGYERIKTTLILQLLGGGENNIENANNSSRNINIVIIGGSSTIKSEFLNFISKNIPNSINFKSNKNKVVLAPKILFDKYCINRYIDSGQIVLLNNGIACIDRIDKLNYEDKLAIEEILKDAKITFCKQNIYEIFNINCSILATVNPKRGKYNVYIPFYKNFDSSDNFISLFDLYFKMIGKNSKKLNNNQNKNYSSVLDNKIQLNENQNAILPIDFLVKYIYYSKTYINPQLTLESKEFISKSYTKLREVSIREKELYELINPITVRTLKSLIKIATAFAKCRLSQKIERVDCENALELLADSIFSEEDIEDENNSDKEIEEEYQEIKNKKKEKTVINEENKKEKIIPLNEEEDEEIEDAKNKKKKGKIKETKNINKKKEINNNRIDNNDEEISKEQTILKYILNYSQCF